MIIAVIAMVVVWISVILPAVGRLQRTAQAIADTQSTQASSTEATANLISALQQRTQLEDEAQQLDHFFIDRANPVAFVSRLEELGVDHNVTLDINLQEPTAATTSPVVETLVTINAAGELPDTLDFMNSLLTDDLFLNVTSATFTTPSDTAGVVNLNLELLSYWK